MFTRKNRNSIQEMSRSSGHHSIRRKSPRETHFSANSSKRFSLQKKSYSPAGCSRLLSSEDVIPAPGLGQIVHRRILHLPHSHLKGHQNFQLPLIPQAVGKDPSTGYQGSQRISPAEGTQIRQKIINDHNTFMTS